MATTTELSVLVFWTLARLTNGSFEDLHVRLSRLLYQFNFKNPALNALTVSLSGQVKTFGFVIRRLRTSPLTRKVQEADRARDAVMKNLFAEVRVKRKSPEAKN